jgi:hypothetical protein
MKYISIIFIGLMLSSCAPPVEDVNGNITTHRPTRKLEVGINIEKVCLEGVEYYFGSGFLEPVPYGGPLDYIHLDKGTSCNAD